MALPEDRRKAFTDAYRFYEQHWDMPDTVEAWTECAKQLVPIASQYDNQILIQKLLIACYEAIDEENAIARRAIAAIGKE